MKRICSKDERHGLLLVGLTARFQILLAVYLDGSIGARRTESRYYRACMCLKSTETRKGVPAQTQSCSPLLQPWLKALQI
jgi:hypothetical protein